MSTTSEPLDQYDYAYSDYIEDESFRKNLAPLIGEFMIAFSELEHDINIAFSEFINHGAPDVGYTIIQHLNIYSTIAILTKLITQHTYLVNSENRTRFLELLNKLDNVRKSRNDVAHANWVTVDENYNVRIKVVSDKETGMVSFKKKMISPEILREEIEEIEGVREELDEFLTLEEII